MKTIPNFSRYFADNDGNLWTTAWRGSKQTRMLKPALSPDGYLKTMIVNDEGKNVSTTIHKMVALAYLGPRPDGCEVNHIDGNKSNNRPDNLEYVTHSQNCKHSFDTGLQKPKRGEINGNSKLTEQDVNYIRHIAATGGRYYGRKKLAEKYGVSEAHIKDIVNRRRNIWGHLK